MKNRKKNNLQDDDKEIAWRKGVNKQMAKLNKLHRICPKCSNDLRVERRYSCFIYILINTCSCGWKDVKG